MYLVITNKSYNVTNNYNKPYIKVNGSILPITTNTTNNPQVKINGGGENTYRPLEYKSQSASNTYYTTMVNSEGLSSITALTRESTSGESYETRVSTSGTSYQTSADGISYYFNFSTYYTNNYSNYISSFDTFSGYEIISLKASTYTQSSASGGITYTAISQTLYLNPTQSKITQSGNNSTFRLFSRSYYYYWKYYYNGWQVVTQSSSTNRLGTSRTTIDGVMSTLYFTSYYVIQMNKSTVRYSSMGNFVSLNNLSEIGNGRVFTNACNQTGDDSTLSTRVTVSYYTSAKAVTTGTSYLTRSSTSATIYLTRSSTSGYSGVSSSSSESSGWE